MTDVNIDELMAEMASLQAENEALKVKRQAKITCRVSQKGAVSVYGLQRFPVTLYANQFERLLGAGDEIRNFIADNVEALASK
jgi:hypothetical protein